MVRISKSHLLAGSAAVGLAAFTANSPALAQSDATGLYVDTTSYQLTVEEGETLSSAANAVVIVSPDVVVINAGMIDGGNYGINSQLTFNAETEQYDAPAAGVEIRNSGLVVGRNNDGIRLEGGGTVINDGLIEGQLGLQTDGVSMFPGPVQANADYTAVVSNLEGGSIAGDRFGVILSGGGNIDNAGDISGMAGGVLVQGIALNSAEGEDRAGVVGIVTNTGTIRGLGPADSDGYGVAFGSDLGEATLVNSGIISSASSYGVSQRSSAELLIQNLSGGSITGATSGIYSGSGSITIENAGTIRGNGIYDGFDAAPDAGITIATGASSVVNSGTISGAGAGITTAYVYDAEADALVGLATGTVVTNSGTISGEMNDGIRLIGGGTVTNSGTISGAGAAGADGISMFRFDDQSSENYSASVINEANGSIAGDRFGIILSGGGSIENSGQITGGMHGIQLQSQGANAGQAASLSNSGTITGASTNAVTFAGDLDTASLDNSGTLSGAEIGVIVAIRGDAVLTNSGSIEGSSFEGVRQGSDGNLLIQNLSGGSITGATSGIYSGSGSITIENAGTIRGNGTYDGFDAAPDAGITIATGASSVVNSGTISGAGAGITTAYVYDAEADALVGLATGTDVTNSGTISGEMNDGIRLIGGGTVTNSGTISGAGAAGADGISMFRFDDQSSENYSASVINEANGSIAGDRFGIILSGGGSIENSGMISGNLRGAQIQSQGDMAGQTASLVNSGSIAGSSDYGFVIAGSLDAAQLENTGVIKGMTGGVVLDIRGSTTLVNKGTIDGGQGYAVSGGASTGSIALVNEGALGGGVLLSTLDDTVTLRTGSSVTGMLDAGEGNDRLTLEGSMSGLTDAQVIGRADNFEALTVARGYWNTDGFVGAFDNVAIHEGATLRVNETVLGNETSSPILTAEVALDGSLVLNFGQDDIVSQLDALFITGTGDLQLVGEAVFTVDTDTLGHTGGTTVANGGLILTGNLLGDVATSGAGIFQLGQGGTEGSFQGDIVNDGRFVFNRSDDYDFLGAFSGSGSLDKYGVGVLTFMGDYSFEGVTNIYAGSVRIGGKIDPEMDFNLGGAGSLDITGNDQTIGGLAGGQQAKVQLGEQLLTIDQTENTTFAGVISGMGGITKDGAGTLILSGINTYTGPTEVNGGKLAVNGSIVSSVTVNAGGSLGGNGTVGDTSITSGGILAPGNSIGRLTIAGDLNFGAGSIYEVEVNAAGEGDRIDATGVVTIDSTATVAVLAENGAYRPRTDYVIVTGEAGVTGTFGSVTTDLAFLDPLLRYGTDTVTLSLYRNDIEFAEVAANPNQAGVAAAVQALGNDNPLFEAALMQNAMTAQTTFGDLSGEILASSVSGLTDDSRHLRNAILNMPAPDRAGIFAWGSVFGAWDEFDATDRNFGMDSDHQGVITGIGLGGAGFGVAVSGGIGGSDHGLGGRNDSAEVESKYLAAHATIGAPVGFNGAAGVSFAWHDIETSRAVRGPTIAQTLTSDRDAETLQLFGEAGYGLEVGNALITPFARLAHVRTESESFAETGDEAALSVGETEQETTLLTLGGDVRFSSVSVGLQPYLSAAWSHAFGDRAGQTVSRFTSGGPAFVVTGVAIPDDSAEVEAGFEYRTGAFSLGAAYSGVLAGDRTSHGARVSAVFAF